MARHKCDMCNETFEWFYKLVQHVTEKHPRETFIMRNRRGRN